MRTTKPPRRMSGDERRAMKALRIIVFAEVRGVCAMPGPHEGESELHHIGGRGNACIWVPELGIKLCAHHHKYAQFAPHNNKKLFMFWLGVNWPEKYKLYMELKDRSVKKRDIDMKQVVADLEKRADEAMYKVA